ncbi:MAG: NTP transferase domain-containing protein [Pseudomonadales bacterium]
MIGAIMLAAGSSRRFGDDKRRSLLPSGQQLLEESIHKAASVIDEVLVVLRFGDREFARELDEKIAWQLRVFSPDGCGQLGKGGRSKMLRHTVKKTTCAHRVAYPAGCAWSPGFI